MALETGVIAGIAALLFWGLADFSAKKVCMAHGKRSAFIFSHIVGLLLFIAYIIMFPSRLPSSPGVWLWLAIGAAVTFAGYYFFYMGLETEKVSVLSPMIACNPIIVIALGAVLLHEKIHLNQMLGIAVAVAGLAMLSFHTRNSEASSKSIVSGIGTMVLWALSAFILGYISKLTDWLFAALAFRLLMWLFGTAFFMAAPAARYFYSMKSEASSGIIKIFPSLGVLPLFIIVGILDISGTIVYSLGTSLSSISLVGGIASLYPAFIIILARLFLKEKLHSVQKIGVIGIIIGLVLTSV